MIFFKFSSFSEVVNGLVLGERKSINTLTYLLLILLAYFGPNAEIMGNIQLSIWQFQRPILDINAYVFRVSLLMFVDLLSLVINGILLWITCKVNIIKVFETLQKDYWILFAVAEAYVLIEVCINSMKIKITIPTSCYKFYFYSFL